MIDRAWKDTVPTGFVLADAGYDSSKKFRYQLRERGLDFALGVNFESKSRSLSRYQTLKKLGVELEKANRVR